MLRAILNRSWRQHLTKQQLYSHLPPITKTIQVRRIRHAGHCWRSRDELISDVLQWTSSHGRAKAGPPARTYIQQLCEDTDVALRTCRKRSTIGRGGEKGSGMSVLISRQDDDDDDIAYSTDCTQCAKTLKKKTTTTTRKCKYKHTVKRKSLTSRHRITQYELPCR